MANQSSQAITVPASASVVAPSRSAEPPTRPGKHGGTLWSGNPKAKGGRRPSWVREQLKQGLEAAAPTIQYALRHGKDKRTGRALTWHEYMETFREAARVALPMQSQVGGIDGAPLNVVLGVATGAVQELASPESSSP